MNDKKNVLDNGFVSLIDSMGDDLTIVNAARVSFAKQHDSFDDDKDTRLIKYLAKHGHWTPFAHPQITLHVKAPIFVARQLFKHKVGLTENEVSRRYVDDEPEFYIPLEWRAAPTEGAKQGSSGAINFENLCVVNDAHAEAACKSRFAYDVLLESGVAPELARMVLPQSMYTEWHWTGSLAAFARVCRQRQDPHAQWESQQYAAAISEIIAPLFPVAWPLITQENR